MKQESRAHQPVVSRRRFLGDLGMGFTGLALGGMLFEDGVARAARRFSPQPGRTASFGSS
jgi:hypothetical protein